MCVSYVAGSYHTTFSHGVTRDDNVLYPAITTTPQCAANVQLYYIPCNYDYV